MSRRAAGTTVFLAAFLAFLAEPMTARFALPLLGGSAQVWNVCVLFFQAALLLGYAAAFAAARWLPRRWQMPALLAALAIGGTSLPICIGVTPGASPISGASPIPGHATAMALAPAGAPTPLDPTRPPADGSPILWLLAQLASHAGLPFLALCAAGPLVAHALATQGAERNVDPYPLYAAGNAGSLLALAVYPFLLEPHLGLAAQARAWSGGYALLMLLAGALAVRAATPAPARSACDGADIGATPPEPASPDERTRVRGHGHGHGHEGRRDHVGRGTSAMRWILATVVRQSWAPARSTRDGASARGGEPAGRSRLNAQRVRWLALALVPASLMLGVTAHMTSEVPSCALLWAIPLAIYLASFIGVFARRPLIPHAFAVAVQPLLVGVVAIVMFVPLRLAGFSVHLLALAATAWVLHGELAASRPPPARLTEFYLIIALGGALGGAFNALVAPEIFPFVAEYPLALVAACALRPARTTAAPPTVPPSAQATPTRAAPVRATPARTPQGRMTGPLVLALALPLLIALLPTAGDERDVIARIAILLVGAAIAALWRMQPLHFSLGIAAVLLAGLVAFQTRGAVVMARSFYGVSRVALEAGGARHILYCGTTIHGGETFQRPDRPGSPTAYFAPGSPIASLLTTPAARRPGARWAVIGLGVGALAWYAGPDQSLTYYEIDPVVRSLAADARCFDFLAGAGSRVKVVMGDGRQSLAREPGGAFDLIVADAFASDAVPVHLLTREALATDMARLSPDGLLVFNTSNRHVRLDAVVAALAADAGLAASSLEAPAPDEARRAEGAAEATWALVARTRTQLERWLAPGLASRPLTPAADVPVWTDDYSSLWSAIRW